MIKGYRKRFVVINMVLIGIVLLAVFIGLDIIMYRSDVNELNNTMSIVLEPLSGDRRPFPMMEETEDGFTDEFVPEDEEMPNGMIGRGRMITDKRFSDDRIVVAFYTAAGGIDLVSDTTDLDSDVITQAVNEIVTLESSSGRLSDYNIIYHREGDAAKYKIALADTSYLTSRLLKNSLILLGVFAAAMVFFFVISLRLSRLAAKPMEDAMEMERQFVADISHDLKTPITVILANNSIIKSSPDSRVAEQLQWIESTDGAAKNMMKLVTEMLTLSRLESTEKNVVLMPTDLSAAAEKTVLQLESIAYDRGIILEDSIEEGISVSASPEYADRICGGLIENALKYEPDGGRVQVSLIRDRKKAVLTVRNLGSVIEKEDLPHIFERFYRGDKSRGTQKGYGLGLPIIRQVTELIGAEIIADSAPDTGTVFTVVFDVCEG